MSEKVKKLQEKLANGVAEMATAEDWQRYLDVAKKFHKYSFHNQFLIAMQRPDATQVMGFGNKRGTSGWKSVGRNVKKGEKGIAILAPQLSKCWYCDDGCKKCKNTGKFLSFRQVYVFDIAQTEGEPLPQGPQVTLLDGDSPYLTQLEALVPEGWTLTYEPVAGTANGFAQPTTQSIVVDSGLSERMKCKTLIHEIAHAYLHSDADNGLTREVKEVEAESVAYIVMGVLGLDSAQYSFGYVAGWSDGNAELIKATGTRVAAMAKQLVEGLEADDANNNASPQLATV